MVFQNDRHANGTVDSNGPNITYVPVSAAGGLLSPIGVADFNSGSGHDSLQNAAIATLASGRQVVAFERVWTADVDHDVFLNVVNAAGTATQFSIANPLDVQANASWQANPAVAAIGNVALVVFEDGTGTTTSSANIRGRFFDGTSNTLGAAFTIADHTARLRTADVAAIDHYRYAITYGDQNDVWVKVLDSTTGILSAGVQLDVTGGFSLNPQVHGAPGAGFVVTWAQWNGADYDVRARLFDGRANAVGSDFIVTSLTDNSQFTPTVAASDHHIFFAWTDFAARPTDTAAPGIRGRSFGIVFGDGLDNVLSGGVGEDIMLGGAGNDAYSADDADDVVAESAGEGTDTVLTSAGGYALPNNVENLTGTLGTGQFLTGNNLDNVITSGAGADNMTGLSGNDAYIINNVGDLITELAASGNDKAFSTIHYALPDNVENLVLQGTADLQGFGNALINVMSGNSGNNLIDGGGGGDLMIGGGGNDTYFVDNIGDVAFEAAGQGNDTVFTTANFGLAADVETLVMQGGANLQGFGNGTANVLFGNTGSNLLNGGGGIDLMIGGLGDDTYFTDDPSDSAFEVAGEGNDAVFATSNYGLAADVETLVMQGSANLQGYGNNQVNTIFGNTGNNLINGAGGADTMIGGMGDDTYFIDNVGDGVVEAAGQGTDVVLAGVSYALTANVEALVLQGGGSIDGIGNALNNSLFGNGGANVLDGGGGLDQLTGNAGNDTFVFRSGQSSGDTLIDFAGDGAAAGDSFSFIGFGTAAGGATFTQIGATNQWQIHSGLDAHNEIITLSNSATVHASDVLFS